MVIDLFGKDLMVSNIPPSRLTFCGRFDRVVGRRKNPKEEKELPLLLE